MKLMMTEKMKIVDDDDDDDDGGGDQFVADVKGRLASSLPSTRWPAIVHKHSEGAESVTNNTNANTPWTWKYFKQDAFQILNISFQEIHLHF